VSFPPRKVVGSPDMTQVGCHGKTILSEQMRLGQEKKNRGIAHMIKSGKRIGKNFKSKQVIGRTIRAAVSSRPVKEKTDEDLWLQKLHLLILIN
jgi:hypothetical protein